MTELLISAEQANVMSKNASEKAILREKKRLTLAKEREIKEINKKIQEAAKEGKNKINTWIKFKDTYQLLANKNYILSGGAVWEELPPIHKDGWGITVLDEVEVSWEI